MDWAFQTLEESRADFGDTKRRSQVVQKSRPQNVKVKPPPRRPKKFRGGSAPHVKGNGGSKKTCAEKHHLPLKKKLIKG